MSDYSSLFSFLSGCEDFKMENNVNINVNVDAPENETPAEEPEESKVEEPVEDTATEEEEAQVTDTDADTEALEEQAEGDATVAEAEEEATMYLSHLRDVNTMLTYIKNRGLDTDFMRIYNVGGRITKGLGVIVPSLESLDRKLNTKDTPESLAVLNGLKDIEAKLTSKVVASYTKLLKGLDKVAEGSKLRANAAKAVIASLKESVGHNSKDDASIAQRSARLASNADIVDALNNITKPADSIKLIDTAIRTLNGKEKLSTLTDSIATSKKAQVKFKMPKTSIVKVSSLSLDDAVSAMNSAEAILKAMGDVDTKREELRNAVLSSLKGLDYKDAKSVDSAVDVLRAVSSSVKLTDRIVHQLLRSASARIVRKTTPAKSKV